MNAQDETPVAVATFQCKKCKREFGSERALQTHEIRAHRKFWTTNAKKPRAIPRRVKDSVIGQSRGILRGAKNAHYIKYRDRYRALGLNAKGKPYKRKPHASVPKLARGKLKCPMCQAKFASSGNLGMHMSRIHGQSLREYRNGQRQPARTGRPPGPKNPNRTCPVCAKKFTSRPNMTLHLRTVHKRSIQEFQHRGGQPLDQAQAPASESPRPRPAPAKQEGREVIFCPVCGTNIHAVQTAVNFADQ
jgi:C2H2 type zinc finger protein/C2H2-type zinc finger protein